MEKYTYSDVIIDPSDPRVEVGKQYYYDDRPASVVSFANNSDRIHFGILSEIQQRSDYPFIFGISPYVCIIRKKESSYVERQDKWLADNDIKVGDKVRIVRKAGSCEDGWDNIWRLNMDEAAGKVGTVSRISANFREWGIEVDVPDVGPFRYPYFVLEKVEQKYVPFDLRNPEVRKSLRGRWIKNKNNNFELCITFFTHQGYVGNTIPADVYMVSGIDADELFQYWVFEDGSPCGKLVEEVENE